MTRQPEHLMQQYAERLLQLRPNLRQLPEPADLDAIALDVGLSLDDLALLRQRVLDHVTRAEGYSEFRRWDDAIAELEQATALDPLNLETLYQLADTHRRRYEQRGKRRDRNAAAHLAHQCLQLDPSFRPALVLLDELEQPRGVLKWLRSPAAGFTVIMLVGLTGAGYGLWTARHNITLPWFEPTPVNPRPAPAPTVQSGTQELEIPVELITPSDLRGLTLDQVTSRLTTYSSGKSFYKVKLLLVNESNQELEKVNAVLTFLDERGKAIATHNKALLDTYEAPLRPGDRHAWDWLKETQQGVSTVQITVQTVESVPAATRYSPGRPIELQWQAQRPTDVDIQLTERRSGTRESWGSDFSHEAELVFENIGTLPVRGLKVRVRHYDAAGDTLLSKERYVVTGQDPSLLPGQSRRLKALTTGLPQSFQYEVVVIEVK